MHEKSSLFLKWRDLFKLRCLVVEWDVAGEEVAGLPGAAGVALAREDRAFAPIVAKESSTGRQSLAFSKNAPSAGHHDTGVGILVLCIASGKGRTGKTNIAAILARNFRKHDIMVMGPIAYD